MSKIKMNTWPDISKSLRKLGGLFRVNKKERGRKALESAEL